jgi:protein-histidine N-methyltransferase
MVFVRPSDYTSTHEPAKRNFSTPTDMSPLSTEYRASSAADSDDSDDDDNGGEETTTQGRAAHAYRRGPGGLTVTRALLDAFTASLDAHKVRLRFFAGGWSTLRECLFAHRGTAPPLPPYDIVLASETIYRTDSLGAFLGALRSAASAPSATTTSAPAPCDRKVEVVVHPPLCLVAAKVLYFGVGGGVQAFVSAIEVEHGTVHTVWEHREGVGRTIMRIEW